MTIKIKQDLIPSSKHSLKAPYAMTAEYITYHNTANSASAKNEINFMKNNNSSTGYHIAVDDVEAIQAIPFNRNAFACGDGKNGTGNRKSISVEVCYSKSGGDKYKKAEANANQVIAQLLYERNWGVDRVKKHQDWSGKHCPHRILDEKRWDAVIKDIQKRLDKLNGDNKVVATPAPNITKGYLSVGDTGSKVKELQTNLKTLGYSVGTIDGIFGKNTETAVKKLQSDNKLKADGLAGNATMQVIDALLEAKKKADSNKNNVAVTPSNVYGTVTVIVDSLNIRNKADFNATIVSVAKKNQKFNVYGQKNGLYDLGNNKFVTANTKYVKFVKNNAYKIETKKLKVIVASLHVYNKPDWNAKAGTVKKNEVFTIAKELTVNGSKMYQLKSGMYITANSKYVQLV